MTQKIYRHPSQVSECRGEDWRCKMAGMAMHLSLGSQCGSLYIQRPEKGFVCVLTRNQNKITLQRRRFPTKFTA